MFGNAHCLEHRLLPERSATFDTCKCVHNYKTYDSLDGTGNEAQGQGLGVVFIPGLDVERQKGWKVLAEVKVEGRYTGRIERRVRTCEQCHDGLPSHAQILGSGENEAFECGIQCINSMIEEFSQGPALMSSSPIPRSHRQLNPIQASANLSRPSAKV